MSPFRMALVHFLRQRTQSIIIVLSLVMALTGAGLLIHVYILNQNRFQGIAKNVNAVVGPKSGGIEILLASLNLEDNSGGYIPLNLFETLRAGADIKFDDGSIVSSKTLTKNIVPILQYAKLNGFNVLGTDESFLLLLDGGLASGGRFPQNQEILVGSELAKIYDLKINDTVSVSLKNSASLKPFIISGILEKQNSSWDLGAFTNLESGWSWIAEAHQTHSVWKNKVLSFFLLQMDSKGFPPLQSLINDRSVAQMVWVETEKQKIKELSGTANDLGLIMILVILCLAGFSIFGMMLIRSNQLRISTATLEAIGYSRYYILKWISAEGFLIGSLAVLLALLLEFIFFDILKTLLDSSWIIPSRQLGTPWWSLFIFVCGLVFSLLGALTSILRVFAVSLHQELKSG